jgi:hypothetical protein
MRHREAPWNDAPRDTAELLAWIDTGWRDTRTRRAQGTPALGALIDHELDHRDHLAPRRWERSALILQRRRTKLRHRAGGLKTATKTTPVLRNGTRASLSRKPVGPPPRAETVAAVRALPPAPLKVGSTCPAIRADTRPAGRVVFGNSGGHFADTCPGSGPSLK